MRKQQYSIGEMSQLCNVSKKALRFYDKIGLISSLRHDYNNYRMYTHDELLMVPVLKYYKQMGFKLDEMKDFIAGQNGNVYSSMRSAFEKKIGELQSAQVELRRCEESVRDWHNLIKEAELVIAEGVREVSVKYVEQVNLLYQEQPFDGDIKSAIINIHFMDYVETARSQSAYRIVDVDIEPGDQIMTLSTCNYAEVETLGRQAVHAKITQVS